MQMHMCKSTVLEKHLRLLQFATTQFRSYKFLALSNDIICDIKFDIGDKTIMCENMMV